MPRYSRNESLSNTPFVLSTRAQRGIFDLPRLARPGETDSSPIVARFFRETVGENGTMSHERKARFDQAMRAVIDDPVVSDFGILRRRACQVYADICKPDEPYQPNSKFTEWFAPWVERYCERSPTEPAGRRFTLPVNIQSKPNAAMARVGLEGLFTFLLQSPEQPNAKVGRPPEVQRDWVIDQVIEVVTWVLGLDPAKHQALILDILVGGQDWLRQWEGTATRPAKAFMQLSERSLKDLIGRGVRAGKAVGFDWLSPGEQEAIGLVLDESDTVVVIECKSCEARREFADNPGIKRANQLARDEGWVIDSRRHQRFCPDCGRQIARQTAVGRKPGQAHPWRNKEP